MLAILRSGPSGSAISGPFLSFTCVSCAVSDTGTGWIWPLQGCSQRCSPVAVQSSDEKSQGNQRDGHFWWHQSYQCYAHYDIILKAQILFKKMKQCKPYTFKFHAHYGWKAFPWFINILVKHPFNKYSKSYLFTCHLIGAVYSW